MTPEVEEGVSLDTCPQHGVWLDFGELAAIISRIKRGEELRRNLAIKRAIEDDRKRRGPGHIPG
jgi:Zn-finger nucleic acid-binding protein